MPFDAQAPTEVTARDRMIQLRDFLASLHVAKFDMSTFGAHDLETGEATRHDCQTPACIGGWARRLYGTVGADAAAACLGLGEIEKDALFYPCGIGASLTNYGRLGIGKRNANDATPAEAVAVLDHYLATGRIDWTAASRVQP